MRISLRPVTDEAEIFGESPCRYGMKRDLEWLQENTDQEIRK